jgi:hypothetical protein
MTSLEEKTFIAYAKACGLPEPQREVRFHSTRKWRFDFAWPSMRLALEVEGGIWTGGAHGRGTGISRDIEKYNYATAMGWAIIRTTPSKLSTGETIAFLKATMATQIAKVTSNPTPNEIP